MSENKLTAGAFLGWVETQPPERSYPYLSSTRCACAQYARTIGVDFPTAFLTSQLTGFWRRMNDVASQSGGNPRQEWTFGALAERLRALP